MSLVLETVVLQLVMRQVVSHVTQEIRHAVQMEDSSIAVLQPVMLAMLLVSTVAMLAHLRV